jgi:serine/threonine-protein kinase RsbW/stage II sporulation protein AB (anti-sigma F factor)
VQLDLSCEASSVGIARNAVARLARSLGASIDDVKIAVSEAVANAVIHAYRDGDPGEIRVVARKDRGRLLVTVADDGIGMTPNPGNPGLRLGIPLITKLCEDVRFTSSDDGTVVAMSFATPSSAGGSR